MSGFGCSACTSVANRVAQTVARMYLEPVVEPVFHPDSYGYRPRKSVLDAVGTCRQRCWRNDWVIDLDIRAFLDTVPHDVVLKAVAHHTDQRWIQLYVQRWLQAPLQQWDGTLVTRDRETPQGSAISPLLANLLMHYAFNTWMVREFPAAPNCWWTCSATRSVSASDRASACTTAMSSGSSLRAAARVSGRCRCRCR